MNHKLNLIPCSQAIEVRTPAAGIKAQWVRIELRKVETLPGGGDRNTFYDYVGPSPVTLWTAPDGFNVLRTVSHLSRQNMCLFFR